MSSALPLRPLGFRAAPWALAGTVMTGYAATLRARGLLPAIRARVSPATLQLLDHPPLAVLTFSGTALDEVLVALRATADDELVRQVAAETCHDSFRPILRLLLQSTLALFGNTPRALFANLGAISTPLVRGVSFCFTAQDETSGLLELVFPTATPEATFLAWEGVARFVIGFAGCVPDVRGHTAAGDGRRVVIPVRWTR